MPLIKAWSRAYGEQETKKLIENTVYGVHNTNLWEYMRNEMTDGEMHHLAVQLGSIEGVKKTAWPGIINWRNGIGETTLEVALRMSAINQGNQEIVEFLEERK